MLDILTEEARAISPLLHVTKDDAPCVVISGGKDPLVLPEHGRWLHEKMDEVGAQQVHSHKDPGLGLAGNMPAAMTETMKCFGIDCNPGRQNHPQLIQLMVDVGGTS